VVIRFLNALSNTSEDDWSGSVPARGLNPS